SPRRCITGSGKGGSTRAALRQESTGSSGRIGTRSGGSGSWRSGRTPGSPPDTLNSSSRSTVPSPRQRGRRQETQADRLRRDPVTARKGGHCDARLKRLEKGSYRFPVAADGADQVEVRAADLIMLLAGVDLASVRRSRRYHR